MEVEIRFGILEIYLSFHEKQHFVRNRYSNYLLIQGNISVYGGIIAILNFLISLFFLLHQKFSLFVNQCRSVL